MRAHIHDTMLFVLAVIVTFQLVLVMAGYSSAILLSTALPHEFQYLTALIF